MLSWFLLALSLAGCAVISSNRSTTHSGQQVPEEMLARLEVGETTRDWVVATLGEPTSTARVDADTEVLRYTSKRIEHQRSGLLLVLSTRSEHEEKQTVYLEFHKNVLKRYWRATE